MNEGQLRSRLDQLADDVGRLRRRLNNAAIDDERINELREAAEKVKALDKAVELAYWDDWSVTLAEGVEELLGRPQTSAAHLADRIAGHTQALHALLEPTAAELAATTAPGDPDAVREAIQIVDERSRRLGGKLAGAP